MGLSKVLIFEKEREAEEEKNKRWVGIDKDKELTTEEKNETSFAKREFPEEEFQMVLRSCAEDGLYL